MHIISFADHVADELNRASYAPERRWLRASTLLLGLVAALATGLALAGDLPAWPAALLVATTLLSGAGLLHFEAAYRNRDQVRGQLRAGLRGQQFLTQVLTSLDDSYYVINNLKLPGRADDVDHMVIGPNGIFALETKHHRGRIFWRDGTWYQSKISRNGRHQPEKPIRDPARQIKRNIDYLRSCINCTDRELSRRTRLWIEGAVVFTHPAVSLDLPDQALEQLPFPALRARDLLAHITGHVPRHPHTKSEIRAIVSLLGHLEAPYADRASTNSPNHRS